MLPQWRERSERVWGMSERWGEAKVTLLSPVLPFCNISRLRGSQDLSLHTVEVQ